MLSINLVSLLLAAATVASASAIHNPLSHPHRAVDVRAVQERALVADAQLAAPAKPKKKKRAQCTRKASSTIASAATPVAATSSAAAPATTTSAAAATTSSKAATTSSSKAAASTSASSDNSGSSDSGTAQGSGFGASGSSYTIKFVNKCSYTVWAAVGQAPSGQPDANGVKFGQKLGAGGTGTVLVDNKALGIRAWGRTGCDSTGANCATGACDGGLVCSDAGITSGVICSEYGFGDFGQYGGERISWDLSRVDLQVNIPTQLTANDGQTVACASGNCASNQAYAISTDYAADRNSPLGSVFTHTFCP